MPIQVNPFRFGGASSSDAFITSVEDATNSATYTFTSHAAGTANASRIIVVGVVPYIGAGSLSISSVTIGGSAATLATNTTSGGAQGNSRIAAIYYRAVAAGTTTTTIVSLSGTANSCGIAVWALYPSSSTPVDAVSNQAASGSASIDAASVAVSTGGTMVAVHCHDNGQSTTWSWSGIETVSENLDSQLGDTGIRWSISTTSVSADTTANTLTATAASGTPNMSIAAASWGP